MTLYALSEEFARLDELLTESGGELTPELEDAYNALREALPAKVDGCAEFARELAAREKALKAEAAYWAEKARAAQRKAESFRTYLANCLEHAPAHRLQGARFRLRIQKNAAPSVEVHIPPSELPAEFQKLTIEANRSALAEAFKSGKPLPIGVHAEQGYHLRID